MSRLILKSTIFALAVILLSASTASAQVSVTRYTVPFAFSAGDQQLPAGDYVVRWDSIFGLIELERRGVESMILTPGIHATPSSAMGRSKLLFNKYGDRYFLHSVERAGVAKREWPPSKTERETAKAAAPQTVALLHQAN